LKNNPYQPRSVPPVLAGRDGQLLDFEEHAAPVIATGRAAQSMPVLYGVRGVGKTSILRTAQQWAAENGFVTAWTSATKGESLLESLPYAIEMAMEQTDVKPTKNWSAKKLTLKGGIAPFGAEVVLEPGENAPKQGAWNPSKLEMMLRESANACAYRNGKRVGAGLLLIIDELHAAKRSDLGVLFNAVQHVIQDQLYPPPLMLLGAGLPDVRGIATISATFGERIDFVEVGMLSDNEVREALEKPALQLGAKFEPRALDLLVEQSANYPFFVQLFGFHTWRAAAGPNQITYADAQSGVKTAREKVLDMYAARWGATSTAERKFLETLATLGGDMPVERSLIAAELGQTTQGISSIRDRLINKAVIAEAKRGFLQFTLPGFADYVLNELR